MKNSSTTSFGGGISNDNSGGTVTVTRSTVSGNIGDSVGGINNNFASGGTIIVTESIISGNTSINTLRGGGIHNNSSGTVTIDRTQVSGNTAVDGGGINNNSGGTINIVNSTISGNISTRTGSFAGGGGIYNNSGGPINVTNTTVVLNSSAGEGGGIKINSSGPVTLKNSIVANNTAATGPDCADSGGLVGPASPGHNLIGDDTGCSFTPAAGDLVGSGGSPVDPVLGPLQDNGGSTLTHELLFGSPAIDAGDNTVCPATDQRSAPRPTGAACDMGAYEANSLPLGVVPSLSQWALIGLAVLLGAAAYFRFGRRRLPRPA